LFDDDWITTVVEDEGTYYERDLLGAVRDMDLRGVYVDVGAHCGNHSTFFALECPADKVVAVEARPDTFKALMQTLRNNGLEERVEAFNLAIHPDLREVSSYSVPTSRKHRKRMPCKTNTGAFAVREPGVGEDVVQAIPLDELKVANVVVLKVDAEGISTGVIRSGMGLIRRDLPVIAVETPTRGDRREVWELLAPLGYTEGPRYGRTRTHVWLP
jgi:FkbM family methyltransferase